jgi:TRAP-type uncharacterized transport system fused permease subunit
MFVYRPELLLMGAHANAASVTSAILAAVVGIVAFAAGMAGYLFTTTTLAERVALYAAAALLLVPAGTFEIAGARTAWTDILGAVVLAGVGAVNLRRRPVEVRDAVQVRSGSVGG